MSEIEIEALVTENPEDIRVDVSSLNLGDTITVADLKLPLEKAPDAYKMFQQHDDGCIKVVLKP